MKPKEPPMTAKAEKEMFRDVRRILKESIADPSASQPLPKEIQARAKRTVAQLRGIPKEAQISFYQRIHKDGRWQYKSIKGGRGRKHSAIDGAVCFRYSEDGKQHYSQSYATFKEAEEAAK